MNYLVATSKSWNIDAFYLHTPQLPGTWHLISQPEQLTLALLHKLQPDYIFFPHWSWQVPDAITSQYPCVCFHMTDVPFGRGGSPLQNLISLGHKKTMLSALKMTSELDSGDVYAKVPLELNGTAQQIYQRASLLIYQIIRHIVSVNPQPQPQQGTATIFQRRTPAQSELPPNLNPEQLYDFIRMLDAQSYPHAYIEYGNWKLELTEAEPCADGTLQAKVQFHPLKGKPL